MIELSWQQLIAVALFLAFGGFVVWCFLKYGGDTITYYTKEDEKQGKLATKTFSLAKPA